MANRRMFSKEITETDSFLDMPLSSQALYFHLGIGADDDGFISPQRVIRAINANKNDLDVLIAKKFCIMFEDGVIVITHRKTNNYLRPDRYTPTLYQEHYKKLEQESGGYQLATTGMSSGIPVVGIGKDSIGSIEEDKKEKIKETISDLDFDMFRLQCPKKVKKPTTKKIWDKLVKEGNNTATIIEGVKTYKLSKVGTDKKFIQHPTTWLNNRGREDEVEVDLNSLYLNYKEDYRDLSIKRDDYCNRYGKEIMYEAQKQYNNSQSFTI